jgi:hypothetical protein
VTEQTKDTLLQGWTRYWIIDSSAALFEPRDHGLRTLSWSTANRRGFRCDYAIVDRQVRLRRVDACFGCPETPARARLRDLDREGLEWLRLAERIDASGKSYDEIRGLLPMPLDEYRALCAADTCVPPALFGVMPETGASAVPDGHAVTWLLDVKASFTGTIVVVPSHEDLRTSLRFHDGALVG